MNISIDDLDPEEGSDDFLARVGQRVRRTRKALRMSRRVLSERSGVSQRYLAQLEAGEGNVSLTLLLRVARALEVSVEQLVAAEPISAVVALYERAEPPVRQKVLELLDPSSLARARSGRIALIGLRGAGKSTLGPKAASICDVPFVELREVIESSAGIPVTEILALYGRSGYRQLEARALSQVADAHESLVLAVAGGIVEEPDTFETLLNRFHTIWLKAGHEDHVERVKAQVESGASSATLPATEELRDILISRDSLYARASVEFDTSGLSVAEATRGLAACIKDNILDRG